MRRSLNPWVVGPVLVAFVIGGIIGFAVTSVSCGVDGCTATAISVGLVSAIVCAIGVGVVVVLAVRSMAEWRAATDAGLPPPEPGCETGPD